MRASVTLPRRPGPSARIGVLLGLALAGAWAAFVLDLRPSQLVPGEGGLREARRFFGHALAPALTYEDPTVPDTARPLLAEALLSAWRTVVFAVAACSLSVVAGLLLGFLGSRAWWRSDPFRAGTSGRHLARCLAPMLYGATRVVIALMRSVHELMWAVLFLAALGLSNLSAVIAIALPYAGTLAKVFSELIDEAPREAADALRAAGASPLQVFLIGLLPRAVPDVTAYALYRFECGLRSSAVLGFFGYATLGYDIAASFENLYYGEVWTYLYVLLALVLAVDRWSHAVRRMLVE